MDHIHFFYLWVLFESFTLQIYSLMQTHKAVLNHMQLNNIGPHRPAMAPQLSWICMLKVVADLLYMWWNPGTEFTLSSIKVNKNVKPMWKVTQGWTTVTAEDTFQTL